MNCVKMHFTLAIWSELHMFACSCGDFEGAAAAELNGPPAHFPRGLSPVTSSCA